MLSEGDEVSKERCMNTKMGRLHLDLTFLPPASTRASVHLFKQQTAGEKSKSCMYQSASFIRRKKTKDWRYVQVTEEEKTWRWLLTWAMVSPFTPMNRRTSFGVASAINNSVRPARNLARLQVEQKQIWEVHAKKQDSWQKRSSELQPLF